MRETKMASSESPTLIEEYSQTFTSLQAGKKELIRWGVEAVVLNRFIVDSAGKTGEPDTKSLLQSIDINQVCLLYTSPSPRDRQKSRMPSSA